MMYVYLYAWEIVSFMGVCLCHQKDYLEPASIHNTEEEEALAENF